jgi:hypothetical protein
MIAAFMQAAVMALACGFIISAVAESRRETKRLRYLEFSPPEDG